MLNNQHHEHLDCLKKGVRSLFMSKNKKKTTTTHKKKPTPKFGVTVFSRLILCRTNFQDTRHFKLT